MKKNVKVKKIRKRTVSRIPKTSAVSTKTNGVKKDESESVWKGKAGSYGIQGRAAAFTISITGSYTNVVGLPLYETYSLLGSVGYLSDLAE